jgi:ATP-dependent helicase/nuclease subunit A
MADASLPKGVDKLMLWPVKTAKSAAPVEAARQALKAAEQQERTRLLYVALTRPRDRLYVSGYEGSRAPAAESWYCQISDALRPVAQVAACADGRDGLVLSEPQTAQPVLPTHQAEARAAAIALPGWATTRARSEQRLTMPLAPSRLAPLETDDEGEPVAIPSPKPVEPSRAPSPLTSDETRFLRGTLTHALFEHLPDLPAGRRAAAAEAYLEVRGAQLGKGARKSIVAETMAVLADKTFAPIFGPDSRAEVPIVADIPRPEGKGVPLRLNGQIDRLAAVGTMC